VRTCSLRSWFVRGPFANCDIHVFFIRSGLCVNVCTNYDFALRPCVLTLVHVSVRNLVVCESNVFSFYFPFPGGNQL